MKRKYRVVFRAEVPISTYVDVEAVDPEEARILANELLDIGENSEIDQDPQNNSDWEVYSIGPEPADQEAGGMKETVAVIGLDHHDGTEL